MRLKLLYGAIACAIIVGGIVFRNYSKALSDAEVLERVNRAIAEEDARLAASKSGTQTSKSNVDVVEPKVDEEQEKQFARDRQEAMEKLQAQADQLAKEELEAASRAQAKEEEIARKREEAKKKVATKRAEVEEIEIIDKKEPSPLESKVMSEMENSLLDNLLRIRQGFEESDEKELKAELEKQAIEICEEFFESQRRLLKKTNRKRSPASDDADLAAVNAREEAMRSKMRKFLDGQLKSPL